MKKIFEQPLTRPLLVIRKNIEKKLERLNRKHSELIQKYRIVYFWNKKTNILCIESASFSIKLKIKFTQKKVAVYLEMPFLLTPILGRYENDFIREILKEIELF